MTNLQFVILFVANSTDTGGVKEEAELYFI